MTSPLSPSASAVVNSNSIALIRACRSLFEGTAAMSEDDDGITRDE